MTHEPDHAEIDLALSEAEASAAEQQAQLRRIQIELDIFAGEREGHAVDRRD